VGEHAVTRAVFLDRDGVLNRSLVRAGKPYPPTSLDDFEILPDVAEACALLKGAGFLLVVVTNQPDVGRGTQTEAAVEAMHDRLRRNLPIDRIEVCYEPGNGQPSEFHKPAPGMVLRAAAALNIDLAASFLVGDRWRDIDCGHAAGCTTLFIDYGYAENLRAQPHHRVTNLLEAARLIVGSLSSLSHEHTR
jgi:D-glycero-D-manno-heptose 1,7-bisphosphate phosphatase